MQRPYTGNLEMFERIAREESKKIDEKIASGKYSAYQKMKLYEQKCMPGLFENIYGSYNKYRSPW